MATQIAEQFGMINSRLMMHDSRLSSLGEKRRSDLLRESRFQRWSKTGADAVELFDEDFIIKTGNTFTLRERPENEKTNFIPKTLFSPLISSDVAQLSFTMTYSQYGYVCGAVPAHFIDTATQSAFCDEKISKVCWEMKFSPLDPVQACRAPPYLYTNQIVLEADCRIGGQCTFAILKDDGKPYFKFYENLSLPFRFAITPLHPYVSVAIKSLTFTTKPTLQGGEVSNDFME
ncbi:hypothetical protein BLNAU_3384 [Blattamonas nauphoetae]|uniref:Uncharacterized protein n=1 Tax=Blattamonas nauphoetae TaxID=2049346 RepID=A0ABQ9YCU7_9EUKA|nr:hypothetical protein BLNAU_3384 [Blattamonas nauphoetae]